MVRLKMSLIVCTLAVIMFSLTAAPVFSQDGTWKPTIEQKAPDFTLKDLSGKNFRLSDHKGNVVLLVFTATWCPYCRTAIPYLKELNGTYKQKGLVIAGIDIEESPQKVSAFAAKYDIPYTTLLDTDATVARLYHVIGIPNFILINKEGVIVCQQCRAIDPLLKSLMK